MKPFLSLSWSNENCRIRTRAQSCDSLESRQRMKPTQPRSRSKRASVLLPTFALLLNHFKILTHRCASTCRHILEERRSVLIPKALIDVFNSFLVFSSHLTCHLWDVFVHRVCISCFYPSVFIPRATTNQTVNWCEWSLFIRNVPKLWFFWLIRIFIFRYSDFAQL